MNRFRTTIVTTVTATTVAAAACLAGISAPGRAAAAGDPFVGMQVLDMLCQSKDGTSYDTPYTISGCQAAREAGGVEIERLVCEGLLEGTFTSVLTVGRRHRVNWACVPGAVV
jgi:hypothetical protein